MKPTCSRRKPAPGVVLRGPDDAVVALRLAVGEPDGELIAALVCDARHQLVSAPVFEGAPFDAASQVLSVLLEAVEGMVLPGIVLALYRRGGTYLTPHELVALERLFERCDYEEADLLDVLIMSGHRWRSVAELAGLGPGGKHDDQ